MAETSLAQAYTEACKIIGDQQVRIHLLEQALSKADQELKEAGDRIVALTTDQSHDQVIDTHTAHKPKTSK
jgi:hypothetical protein